MSAELWTMTASEDKTVHTFTFNGTASTGHSAGQLFQVLQQLGKVAQRHGGGLARVQCDWHRDSDAGKGVIGVLGGYEAIAFPKNQGYVVVTAGPDVVQKWKEGAIV